MNSGSLAHWPPKSLVKIVAIAGLAMPAWGADIRLLALDAFGRPLRNCTSAEFRSSSLSAGGVGNELRKFNAAADISIPVGTYDVSVMCNGASVHDTVEIHKEDRFKAVVASIRLMRADHVRPELRVEIAMFPPNSDVWWIRLVGIFNGRVYSERFHGTGSEARFVDPEPGSYLAVVQDGTGYSCSRRIDFIEFTRAWRFDPTTCSFSLDRYAHLVSEKLGGNNDDEWYVEMGQEIQRFMETLRNAAEK